MDVLNATLYPIEDRVYRLIPIYNSVKDTEEVTLPNPIYLEEEENYDPNLPIMHQGDKFYITIYIPEQLIGWIIGQGGRSKKILEEKGAKIDVGRKKEGGVTTISGSSKWVVSSTYYKVMERVTIGRLRKESTHFVSVPINSPEVQESFLEFKKEILEKYKRVRGIDESIFQNPSKLHVTITPLVLLDERDNQNAIAILTKCTDNLLKDFSEKEFKVQVKGLEYMNDDPAEVDVLYAEVFESDGDNRLQIIADNIMKEFCAANLSKKQRDKVKLHITLINTLFRSKLENKDADDKDEEERQTFDARSILKDYKDYDFGQIVISEIHISVRYTTAPDNFYMAIKKVKLNV